MYTSDKYPPQRGETWQSIHTHQSVMIKGTEIIRSITEVIYTPKPGEEKRCVLKTFIANWKREKAPSKWFLGAF